MGDPSVPGIRTFQMDASTVGVLKNSVNLFRGDVNYTQPLFSMPGRSAGDGLQIDISIQYQSNVHNQAMTWNRDWPTGILGMGWSMPMAVITLETGGVPTLRRYTLEIGGVPGQLTREAVPAPLFDVLDPAVAAQLAGGHAVPAALRGQFGKRGLPLSAGAVLVSNAGSWRIQDDDREREYVLAAAPGGFHVFDGGESYQLANYRFWKVIYYPRYERWEVTSETGQITSYGGGVAGTAAPYGYKTNAGNSIEWGVQWSDPDGHALWSGNSALTTGQQQYARAWHIARAWSQFGDSVRYGYNELERADGLLPGVEQLVGDHGKPYTKACYLTSITDVFGRKALFGYESKLWDGAPASPREYADPHKRVPDNAPNGFQDCYETFYLDHIAVQDVDGKPLFSLQFTYNPSPGATGAQAVANVAGGSGDTCKRLLTGFEMRNPAGASLPGFLFTYHLEAGQESSPGALKRITWPSGGSATYAYQQAKLDICQRTAEVGPPDGIAAGATPRVWFGPDYAVVLWCHQTHGQLSLQILGWNGQWQSWQPDKTALLANGPGIRLESLTVLTSDNFVAVLFDQSPNTNLHLFRKDPARPARWVAASIPNDPDVGTGGCNSPTLTWQQEKGEVSGLVGQNFLLVAQTNQMLNTGSYDVLTWNWPNQSWTRSPMPVDSPTLFGGGAEYYAAVTLDPDKPSIVVHHLAPTGEWEKSLPSAIPSNSGGLDDFALACGGSLLALSHLSASSPTSQTYEVSLFNWNSDYTLSAATTYPFRDEFDESHPTSWAPTIVSGAMVAVAGNLMRFNGQKWLVNQALSLAASEEGVEQRYAYGPDFGILLNASATTGRVMEGGAQLLAYDANSHADGWTDSPQAIDLPPNSSDIDCWASAGNPDYLTVGTGLFFRGTTSNWSEPASRRCIADLSSAINNGASSPSHYKVKTQSVVNDGPQFLCLAAEIENQMEGSACFALPLRNGGLPGAQLASQMLADQRMWTFAEGDGHGPGTWPGGDSAFFTYPADTTLDDAHKVFLHRYAGDAIQGPISHWPVSIVAIDDGLSESSITTYVPDPAKAGCDASGNVVKYFKSTVYPGSDQHDRANGSVQNTYLNGNEIADGTDFLNVMDGLLASSTISDREGTVLMETRNEWTAYDKRAGDPCDGTIAPLQLYGAYVLKTGQTMLRDGVPSAQSTSYVPDGLHHPYTGQPAMSRTDILNGGGQAETDVLRYSYACEVDQSSRVLHRLTSPAGKTMSNGGVTTSASATTLTGWATLWGDDVLMPAEEASFGWIGGASVFPRAGYQPEQTPPHWQAVSRVLQRDRHGNVIEHADGAGTRQSALMSESLGLPIATFNGAALAECAWNNFQDYEKDPPGWDLGSTTPCLDNAWLGAQSRRLPPGASLGAAVKPAADRRAYLLGFRYQTQGGYNPAGSGWTAKPGNGQCVAGFADTQGQWRYVTAQVALPAGTASLELRAHNGGSGDVLLDSVLLVPFGTDVTTQSWHQAERLLRASMNAAGNASFNLYDNFWRPLGAVGGTGQLQELNARFLSRQGSPDGQARNASPNAELTLHMASGGVAETFLDGGKWRDRWQPGDASLWKAHGGVLVKTSTVPDSLTWRGAGAAGQAVAFFVETSRPQVFGGPVEIRFGAGQAIAWTPGAGWSWSDGNGASVQAALAAPPAMASQWLLVLAANHLLFFGDGQLLFSREAAVTADERFAFLTGPNALQINNLGHGLNPRLGLSYLDGAARQRQVHQLRDGNSVVMEVVYDALDRKIAQTRPAPGSFGSGANVPPLRYRATFLEVPAFLTALQNSCAMRGDVAAYYTGQSEAGLTRSNDQNYPYYGWRYGGTPLQRVTECGQPGLELSIHDVDTTTPAQRKTTRTVYAANGQGDGLPAGQYTAQTIILPSGNQGRLLSDTAGRAVLSMQMDDDGGNVAQTQVRPGYSDGGGNGDAAGTSGVMRLPNAYGGGPVADTFVRTLLQNPLGQPSVFADPDTGQTTTLFNRKGKARFVRVALEPDESHFLYVRYDALGRMVEEGMVRHPWNAPELSAQADNLAYPGPDDGAVAARAYQYDGDGNDPNNIGKLVQTVTFNPAPASHPDLGACTVEERWTYDALGRVRSATLDMSGAAGLNAGVTYHYNNLNEIVQIDLPAGSPLASIVYAYNDQGQVASIGVPGAPEAIARYTWSADGQLAAATRGGLDETWAYDSSGQVSRHQVAANGQPLFAQSFRYTPDGQIASRKTTNSASDAERTSHYRYDAQQRLAAAETDDGQPGSLTISTYDLDGNILAGVQDGNPFAASCRPGTNRLESASLAGNQEHGFRYRNDGRPDLWRGMKLDYDPALGMASAASNGSLLARYARGLNNHLVLRQSGGAHSISFLGAGDLPLVIWTDGQPQACVWGPGGLVAAHDGGLRYPVSDHQNTTWAVSDTQGNGIARYDYQPFGAIQSGSATGSWPFQYAGKSWDAETGLYDFGTRLYDPVLMRFLQPDPARQYASAYIFVNNNPLNLIDPDGNRSVWAQVGVDVAMAVVIIAGVALAPETGGTSEFLSTEAIVAAMSEEAEATEASAFESRLANATAKRIPSRAETIARSIGSGALQGAGTSGMSYDLTHGRDFTWKAFGQAVFSGAVSGGVAGALDPGAWGYADSIRALGNGKGMVVSAALAGGTSVVAGAVTMALTDAVYKQHSTLNDYLIQSAGAFGTGALSGAFSGLRAISPADSAVEASDHWIVRTSNNINKLLRPMDSIHAQAAYIIGGVHVTAGYAALRR